MTVLKFDAFDIVNFDKILEQQTKRKAAGIVLV